MSMRTDDGHRVRDHVAFRRFVHRGQMRKPGCADLQAIGLVGAVGHQIDAELALRMLDAA